MWSSELMKLAPVMVMVCPAAPLDGLSESITGGPPGVAAMVVDVDVVDVVVLDAVPGVLCAGCCPPPDGATVARGGLATRVLPPCRDRISAMASATTATATTATAPSSQRSDRPAVQRVQTPSVRRIGATGTGGRYGSGGVGASGATVFDARTRRTALSIAPRARGLGVPAGGWAPPGLVPGPS